MIYTHLHVLNPIDKAVFPLSLRHTSKTWFLNTSAASSVHAFFHNVREQKEVIGCQIRAVRRMTHQFDVLTSHKDAGLNRYTRAPIAICFPNFSEDLSQTNCGIPLIVTRCLSGTVAI